MYFDRLGSEREIGDLEVKDNGMGFRQSGGVRLGIYDVSLFIRKWWRYERLNSLYSL